MADKANTIHVEIFGQTYAVHAGADPAYIQELAAYVDKKMRAVGQSATAVDSVRAAVLTALNLADESFRLRQGGPEGAKLRERAKTLIHELDVVLKD